MKKENLLSSGLRLQVSIQDNAKPRTLLLLHGFMDCSETFFPLIPMLSQYFNLVSFDLRGHGNSAHAANGIYSYQESLIDTMRIAECYLPEKFSILGHSFGASLAARFAGLFPEKIRSLVCVEGFSGLKTPSEERNRIRQWLLQSIDMETKERWMSEATAQKVIASLYPAHTTENREKILQYMTLRTEKGIKWKYDPALKNSFPMPFPPELSRELWQNIDSPVLIAMGKDSHLYPKNMAEILKNFQQLTYVEIAGVGHNIHHEAPQILSDEILKFYKATKII